MHTGCKSPFVAPPLDNARCPRCGRRVFVSTTVRRAAEILKGLDEIDCGDYSRECDHCGGAGTVGCIHDGMPGQDWCPICGGTGFTWDADQQRREKLEIIAACLTANATDHLHGRSEAEDM